MNLQEVKLNSPDYKNQTDREVAIRDFLQRIEHYVVAYQPIDETLDK